MTGENVADCCGLEVSGTLGDGTAVGSFGQHGSRQLTGSPTLPVHRSTQSTKFWLPSLEHGKTHSSPSLESPFMGHNVTQFSGSWGAELPSQQTFSGTIGFCGDGVGISVVCIDENGNGQSNRGGSFALGMSPWPRP